MNRSCKNKVLLIFTVLILIFSTLTLSGCLNDDDGEGIVGIPEGEDPEGEVHEDHVEVLVPIMNTYEEPKQIVMKFEIVTEEDGRYSENKFIVLPEDSVEVYHQVVEIPENETPNLVDTEIIVWYEEIKIVEVGGESSEGSAVLHTRIANTKFDSERILVEFIVTTEEDIYSEKKRIEVTESSMEVYTAQVEVHPEEVLVDFDAQIIG